MYAVTDFVQWIGRMMRLFGLEESVGVVWGLILLKGKPVTQKEIVKETKYSTSLVSVNLSKLERLGFITSIGRKGRCKLYRSSKSFLDGLKNYLKRITDIEITNAISHLSKDITKIDDEVVRENAEKIIKEYEKLRIFLVAFIKILDKNKDLEKEKLTKVFPNITS